MKFFQKTVDILLSLCYSIVTGNKKPTKEREEREMERREELEAIRLAEMDKVLIGETPNWEVIEKANKEIEEMDKLFKRLFL